MTWVDCTDDEAMKGMGEINIAQFHRSGATFGAPVTASTFNEIGFRPAQRLLPLLGLASSRRSRSGPDGEIYIAYVGEPPDNAADDGDVYLVSSTDEGKTWTTRDAASTTTRAPHSSSSRPWPWTRTAASTRCGATCATTRRRRATASTTPAPLDRGATWGFEDKTLGITTGNTRVTDFASNPNRGFPNGLFLGDYFSIRAASNDDVYMVWADTRLGEYGAPNQKIGFARRKAVPVTGGVPVARRPGPAASR